MARSLKIRSASMICKNDPQIWSSYTEAASGLLADDGRRSRYHHKTGTPEERVYRLYFTLTVMIGEVVAGVSLIFLGFSFAVAAAASKPNLVLITLDSTRADRMGFLGAKLALTPNLDRLAGESIVFEHAYAQAPASFVSHATILSGAYPPSVGMSAIGGALPSSLLYLPDLLKKQGDRTAAFAGSIGLDPPEGLARG